MRFLSVSSGSCALSVHEALPKTPDRRSGLAASMARNAFSSARPTSREAAADVGPVRAVGDREAVVGRGAGVRLVAGLVEGGLILLVPHVGEALEEEQREDVLLVVAGVDQAPQELGRAPEVGLELLLAHVLGGLAHASQPPSVRTSRRRSSAARHSASACLKAATASGSGGISSPMGGST